MKTTKLIFASLAALSLGMAQGALTTTIIGSGGGSVTDNGGGSYTLSDSTDTGDFWNGDDEGTYHHEDVRVTGSFSAVVRITGQSEAANGRWGKAGIMARDTILGQTSSMAMAQVASGNGSQAGGADPVPNRLSVLRNQAGDGGGEIAILPETTNNTFNTDGSVTLTWLRLDYDSANGNFRAGHAADVAGAPGAWSFSPSESGVYDADPADGWWVGMAYSAHNSMSLASGEGQHSVTFDNFSITQGVPEPSTTFLGLGALGLLIRRKR
ncbi:MAG: hypothetical protein ACN4GG_08305 [Akkermansiaceae bacterium]